MERSGVETVSDFDLTREIALEQEVKRLEKLIAAKDTKLKELREELARAEDYKAGQGVYCLRLEEQMKIAIDALKNISNEDYRGFRSRLSIIAIEALKQVGVEYENLQIK